MNLFQFKNSKNIKTNGMLVILRTGLLCRYAPRNDDYASWSILPI
jgi:hypothetical protein